MPKLRVTLLAALIISALCLVFTLGTKGPPPASFHYRDASREKDGLHVEFTVNNIRAVKLFEAVRLEKLNGQAWTECPSSFDRLATTEDPDVLECTFHRIPAGHLRLIIRTYVPVGLVGSAWLRIRNRLFYRDKLISLNPFNRNSSFINEQMAISDEFYVSEAL